MRLFTIAVALVFAVAFAAGCGGGSDTASDTDTVATDTTDETTTETTTDEDDDGTDETTTEASGIFGEGECARLLEASADLSQAFAAAGGVDADLEESQRLFEEFADNAPEEIRDDLRVLAEAYAEYADALGDVEIEPGQAPSAETLTRIQQALASIDQTEVTAASNAITVWTNANC